jgi:phytoene synthase
MVNFTETWGVDPAMGHAERALALGYAAPERRRALSALFALDASLAKLTRHTRDPMVAQMRLTWWHEALSGLAERAIPGQPILIALEGEVAEGRATPAGLAAIVEGWEALLDGEALDHARRRGGALFTAAAGMLGADDVVTPAGEGWALADLALATPDPAMAATARAAAAAPLAAATAQRWSRGGRALGGLALAARADLAGAPEGAPGRVLALLKLRLTGR